MPIPICPHRSRPKTAIAATTTTGSTTTTASTVTSTTVTHGAGTDSITWSYAWGTDSLMFGENFVCAQPLESDAGTTNNEGMGTPFAGNIEVYPLYRMVIHSDVAEAWRERGIRAPVLTVAPNPCLGKAEIAYSLSARGTVSLKLYDVAGKLVRILATGSQVAGTHRLPLTANDRQRTLAGGIYILRLENEGSRVTRKLVIE